MYITLNVQKGLSLCRTTVSAIATEAVHTYAVTIPMLTTTSKQRFVESSLESFGNLKNELLLHF